MNQFSRRQIVAGLLSAPLLRSISVVSGEEPMFAHGIASGDPDSESVVLWTRVTTRDPIVSVEWELSLSSSFRDVVASGEVTTNIFRDHTVKVLPTGLRPGTNYWYRFKCAGQWSPIGRTKTLPVGTVDQVGIALVSCSNYAFGFFNAYQAIADNDDVDVVLHIGDYIYEYGSDGWGGDIARKLSREHVPAHEIITLADYRLRHAQYKSDVGSMAMHARHPLIALWDDHESANNPWIGGAQNHQQDTEGEWRSRRMASVQAYYEWMPVREPALGRSRLQFWRRYQFGDLATLVTLESRHTARAEQVNYWQHFKAIDSSETARAFEQSTIDQPGRRVLSLEMEAFLQESLQVSRELGQPWRLLGNAIPMARVRTPNLEAAGIAMPADAPKDTPDFVWKGRHDLPLYLDTWDGYSWARERLYQQCQSVGVNDLMVLTGDSHSFWANQLCDGAGNAMGVEIGTAGVTSPGDFIEQGFDRATATALDTMLATHNPEVRWTDNLHQGYVLVTLTPKRATVDYIAVSTLLSKRFSSEMIRREHVAPVDGSLVYV